MVTMGVLPFQEKTHMVGPGIEPGISCLEVKSSEHHATRLVSVQIVHRYIWANCLPS